MAVMIVCDICGREADVRNRFVIDRKMDAAGSMSDDLEEYDFCWEHRSRVMERAFDHACKKMTEHEKGRIVVGIAKEMIAARKQ